MKDGESDGKGGRWCAGHGQSHGDLHVCPLYSDEIRAKLEGMAAKFRDDLRSPEWCDQQRRNGVPEWSIELMGAFAGVRPRSGKPS